MYKRLNCWCKTKSHRPAFDSTCPSEHWIRVHSLIPCIAYFITNNEWTFCLRTVTARRWPVPPSATESVLDPGPNVGIAREGVQIRIDYRAIDFRQISKTLSIEVRPELARIRRSGEGQRRHSSRSMMRNLKCKEGKNNGYRVEFKVEKRDGGEYRKAGESEVS